MQNVPGKERANEVPPPMGSDDRRGLGCGRCTFGAAAAEQSSAAKLDRRRQKRKKQGFPSDLGGNRVGPR